VKYRGRKLLVAGMGVAAVTYAMTQSSCGYTSGNLVYVPYDGSESDDAATDASDGAADATGADADDSGTKD
jgi:hypothetical protein